MRDEIQPANGLEVDTQMVRLGEKVIVDDNVVLGYLPVRGGHIILSIGDGARIRYGTIIYGGSRIGCNLETGHFAIIREENDIGDSFRIWNNSVVDYGCHIGNNVKVHNKVYIAQYTTIEDEVFLAPGVTLANDMHPGCPNSHDCMRGPYIKKGAQIGINVTVLPRVVIGEYAVIGAGSVVTRDVPDGTIAYGNPARVKGNIENITCSTGQRDKPYSHLTRRV
jgi:acetyltransferase-like isoleucine patch superfamily enzyme